MMQITKLMERSRHTRHTTTESSGIQGSAFDSASEYCGGSVSSSDPAMSRAGSAAESINPWFRSTFTAASMTSLHCPVVLKGWLARSTKHGIEYQCVTHCKIRLELTLTRRPDHACGNCLRSSLRRTVCRRAPPRVTGTGTDIAFPACRQCLDKRTNFRCMPSQEEPSQQAGVPGGSDEEW